MASNVLRGDVRRSGVAAGEFRCRHCGGRVDPAVSRCPCCGGVGPRVRWTRRLARAMSVVTGIPFALMAIGIGGYAFAVLLSMVRPDLVDLGEGLGLIFGFLFFTPGFFLLVPAGLFAVLVKFLIRHAYPTERLSLAWDYRDGTGLHAMGLPQSGSGTPDHAWLDGHRLPLTWMPGEAGRTEASLRLAGSEGDLEMQVDVGKTALLVGAWVVMAVLLRDASGGINPVMARYQLVVPGATVEEVEVKDGERRSGSSALAA